MALQFNSSNIDTGLTINDAYARVDRFSGDKHYVGFSVQVFVNQSARADGKSAIAQLNFEVPYVDGMSMVSLYNHLKTLPEFAGAIDV